MCRGILEYREELEARHARLILLAQYISAQLLEAPELASPQQANQGVAKSPSSPSSYQAVAGPRLPLVWSDCLTAPTEQRRPPSRLWLAIMVYGILIFSLGCAVGRYV